MVVVG